MFPFTHPASGPAPTQDGDTKGVQDGPPRVTYGGLCRTQSLMLSYPSSVQCIRSSLSCRFSTYSRCRFPSKRERETHTHKSLFPLSRVCTCPYVSVSVPFGLESVDLTIFLLIHFGWY